MDTPFLKHILTIRYRMQAAHDKQGVLQAEKIFHKNSKREEKCLEKGRNGRNMLRIPASDAGTGFFQIISKLLYRPRYGSQRLW